MKGTTELLKTLKTFKKIWRMVSTDVSRCICGVIKINCGITTIRLVCWSSLGMFPKVNFSTTPAQSCSDWQWPVDGDKDNLKNKKSWLTQALPSMSPWPCHATSCSANILHVSHLCARVVLADMVFIDWWHLFECLCNYILYTISQ